MTCCCAVTSYYDASTLNTSQAYDFTISQNLFSQPVRFLLHAIRMHKARQRATSSLISRQPTFWKKIYRQFPTTRRSAVCLRKVRNPARLTGYCRHLALELDPTSSTAFAVNSYAPPVPLPREYLDSFSASIFDCLEDQQNDLKLKPSGNNSLPCAVLKQCASPMYAAARD